MNNPQSQDVLAYRLERFKNAPRKWAYWIVLFSIFNAAFLYLNHDVIILAGLVFPFMRPGLLHHLAAAAVLGALASYPRSSVGLKIVFVIYAADTLFSAYIGWWSGVAMHAVVFAFVAIALNGVRILEKQSSCPTNATEI